MRGISMSSPIFGEEGAYFLTQSGALYVAEGPFESVATLSGQEVAFYVNDFALSSPAPWKIPSQVEVFSSVDEFLSQVDRASLEGESQAFFEEALKPKSLDPGPFAQVFKEIQEQIRLGVLQKTVPVVTSSLTGFSEPLWGMLLRKFLQAPRPLFSYAFWQKDQGFMGATPEYLFLKEEASLKTMALAGTAREEESSVFSYDDKEIREHEFVAQTLVEKMSDYGKVEPQGREVLSLGALIHFLTRIEVSLHKELSLEELIARLHPTPALGSLPRNAHTLALLYEWRARLQTPAFFGAPFGLWAGGRFECLVAIRGLQYEKEQLWLSAGCGIIEGSRLMQEWNELSLKRASILSILSAGRA